ncbi:phage tail-collar fiber domain-containing protein [Thermaerobacillus caldiproteolyticus]|uniref:phage tail-collar fiber domain-containing protein n=1 Tax=Thermaerobacillus caldiproteolyticus TaxID=247480 RepID=UPI00188B6258|nr:phage tail protein [Anoxybacillus caldiproteolyticus]QPA33373.1 phage tail protein [Anoxybacillus caldiproteolyticus]
MGAFGGLIQTNRGRNLQAKAQTGIPLQFTRVALGDGQLGGSLISDLNALKNEKLSLPITKLKVLPDGQAVIGVVFSNQDLTSGFYFREIGVFAQDPTLGEILYCYGNAGTSAEYIPAGGGADIIEKTIDIFTIIGNAPNVTAVINQSMVYETPEGAQQKADEAEENAKNYFDSQKGQPNGVATLGPDGKVPASQLNVSTTANAITITDSGGYYTGGDVESALQEIGQAFNAVRGNLITTVNAILNDR